MRKMRDEEHTQIDPTHQTERKWKAKVFAIHAMTLRDIIEGSWYLG